MLKVYMTFCAFWMTMCFVGVLMQNTENLRLLSWATLPHLMAGFLLGVVMMAVIYEEFVKEEEKAEVS